MSPSLVGSPFLKFHDDESDDERGDADPEDESDDETGGRKIVFAQHADGSTR